MTSKLYRQITDNHNVVCHMNIIVLSIVFHYFLWYWTTGTQTLLTFKARLQHINTDLNDLEDAIQLEKGEESETLVSPRLREAEKLERQRRDDVNVEVPRTHVVLGNVFEFRLRTFRM